MSSHSIEEIKDSNRREPGGSRPLQLSRRCIAIASRQLNGVAPRHGSGNLSHPLCNDKHRCHDSSDERRQHRHSGIPVAGESPADDQR
jgi:hypothetical protein